MIIKQKIKAVAMLGIYLLLFGLVRFSFSAESYDKADQQRPAIIPIISEILLSGKVRGIFIDSAVSGLRYKTSSGLSGKTGSDGGFQYRASDTVEFFVGNISLGEIKAGELVSVLSLQNFSQAAMLLQSLDEDHNPSTGIKISIDSDSKLTNSTFVLTEVAPNDSSFTQKYEQLTGKKFNINEENSVKHSVSSLAIEMLKRSSWNYAYKYYMGDIVYQGNTQKLSTNAQKRINLYFWQYLTRFTLDLAQKEIWSAVVSDLNSNANFRELIESTKAVYSAVSIVAGNPYDVLGGFSEASIEAAKTAGVEILASCVPGNGTMADFTRDFIKREGELLFSCVAAFYKQEEVMDCVVDSTSQIVDIFNNARTAFNLSQNTEEMNSYTVARMWLEEWYWAAADVKYLENKFGMSKYSTEAFLDIIAKKYLSSGATYNTALATSIINDTLSITNRLTRMFFDSTQLPRDIPTLGDVLKFDIQDPIVNGNDLVFCYQVANQVNDYLSVKTDFRVTPNSTGYTPANISKSDTFFLNPLENKHTNCATLTVSNLVQGEIKEDIIDLKLRIEYEKYTDINPLTETVEKNVAYHLNQDIMQYLRDNADLLVSTVSPVITTPGEYCLLKLEHELPLYGLVGYFWQQMAAQQSGMPVTIIDADWATAMFLVPELSSNVTQESLWFVVTVTSETGKSVNKVVNVVVKAKPQTSTGTVISAGQTWMDRNLGASRVATSSTDSAAYGDLYQWGRGADGHQLRTSPTTSMTSATDVPGHGSFITTNTSPYDWRVPQNNSLWQGVSGTNNPCPAGFRLPTDTELDTERDSWASDTTAGAYTSPLKLVVAGYRFNVGGTLGFTGGGGYYWSSTVSGSDACYLYFSSDSAGMYSAAYRADGLSVRCIQD